MAGEIIVDKITASAGYSLLPVFESGGRLTLVANTPVMNTATTNTSIIYYVPYKHSFVMTFNGANLVPVLISSPQLSINIAANVAGSGPGVPAANSNYDLFVWNNNGTLTLSLGPAWANTTSRGSGAGTAELDRTNSLGLLTNNQSIVNGPPAHQGTYLGTISTNTFKNVDWDVGGVTIGGHPATLNIWNMYNRIAVKGIIGDSTGTWYYGSTSPTARPANNSLGMRVSFIQGLLEEYFTAYYHARFNSNSAPNGVWSINAIGYNTTSSFNGTDGVSVFAANLGLAQTTEAKFSVQQLGFGYMQALEMAYASGTQGYYGGYSDSGVHFEGMF